MDAFPIVRIVWRDPWGSGGTTSAKKAKKNKGVYTVSVGYLIGESKDGVTLAMDIYKKKKEGGNGEALIEWGVIEEYDELEIS